MRNHQRIIFTIRKFLFVLLFLASLLLGTSESVSADIAPPDPPLGSDLEPSGESTQVRMMSEYVLVDVAGYSDYDSEHAYVTAIFYMRNLSEEDESMTVRFPLHSTEIELEMGGDHCGAMTSFPPIDEFRAWVNNVPVNVTISEETIPNPKGHLPGEEGYITVPCWATFDVVFPAETDVTVKVSYKVSGYLYAENEGNVSFSYVLGTGAGWKDTIGEANIVFRMPYEVTELNYLSCYPDDCEISGNEITWFYEDFEPEGIVSVRIIKPSIWQRILAEKSSLEKNPDDGEAWGRLGKAYKEAIFQGKGGNLAVPPGPELYVLSEQAYQKAVTLLPKDADWHFGFAELLCRYAQWEKDTIESWLMCLEELKKSLDINPSHDRSNDLLEYIASLYEYGWMEDPFVDLSGAQPEFLLLTSQPTSTPTETPTAIPFTPTETVKVETSTATPVQTQEAIMSATIAPAIEHTPTQAAKDVVITMTPTPTVSDASENPSEKLNSSFRIYFGVFLVIAIVVTAVVFIRKRSG